MTSFNSTFLTVLFCLISTSVHAQKLVADSGKDHVQLIELYSSESCSSCPPADEWISSLKTRSGLWKSFVPIVFHVDYWNHLGWKDGLSSDAMTKRQRDIAQTWPKPLVYTPGVVVDGNEWKNWGRSFPKKEKSKGLQLLIHEEKENTYEVEVKGLGDQPSKTEYVVKFANLGMDLSSNVTSGENSGKLLRHNFVVLEWESKAVTSKGNKVIFHLSKNDKGTGSKAVVAWIEKTDSPISLQATGGYR